ncbi:HNH endonuclease [Gracilibacillus saliphilus]|uniref:HNH endonuclease n=1 Tax=Gracilibacillus saliphilus TaxID=543890 RepID=UPI0013D89A62|nr:HNH endonuclease [Gracilibacillus saliphilus]
MPEVPKINPNHKRRVPKQKDLTRITQKVRKEVLRRSEGKCERCGRTVAYCFEMSHLEQASQLGSGSDPANIALLCGPSVNSGTCHHFADKTKKGREWRKQKKRELEGYYERQNH